MCPEPSGAAGPAQSPTSNRRATARASASSIRAPSVAESDTGFSIAACGWHRCRNGRTVYSSDGTQVTRRRSEHPNRDPKNLGRGGRSRIRSRGAPHRAGGFSPPARGRRPVLRRPRAAGCAAARPRVSGTSKWSSCSARAQRPLPRGRTRPPRTPPGSGSCGVGVGRLRRGTTWSFERRSPPGRRALAGRGANPPRLVAAWGWIGRTPTRSTGSVRPAATSPGSRFRGRSRTSTGSSTSPPLRSRPHLKVRRRRGLRRHGTGPRYRLVLEVSWRPTSSY